MKKTILTVLAILAFGVTSSYADYKKVVYKGEVVSLDVKDRQLTTIKFPEPILKVVRGNSGMDHYEVDYKEADRGVIYVLPFDSYNASAFFHGESGEIYSLKFINGEIFDSKVVIAKLGDELEASKKFFDIIDKNPPDLLVRTKSDDYEFTQNSVAELDHPFNQKVPTLSSGKTKPNTETEVANDVTESVERVVLKNENISSVLPDVLQRKITLQGNDLPLEIYFNAISKVIGYNVIMEKRVEDAKASIDVTNIEVWRALKSLLYQHSYGFKLSEDDIVISAYETRVYDIKLPAVQQSFVDSVSNESFSSNGGSSGSEEGSSQDIKVGGKIFVENKSPGLSLWRDLESDLNSLITTGEGKFSLSPSTGKIIVSDKPGVLDKIGVYIDGLNKSITLQQSFEIQIVEVTLTDEYEFGIDWNAIAGNLAGGNAFSLASNLSSAGFGGGQFFKVTGTAPKGTSGASSSGVSAVLKALDDIGDVEVVNRPHIVCTNLKPCIFQNGTSETFISESGQTFNDNATVTTLSTSQVHEGLTMRILAKIGDESEETRLNISASVSTIDSITSVQSGNVTIQTPIVSNKSINTDVGIMVNESIILGGLISTTVSDLEKRVPGISRIPIIGKAFRHKATKNNKKELVIIITPKNRR